MKKKYYPILIILSLSVLIVLSLVFIKSLNKNLSQAVAREDSINLRTEMYSIRANYPKDPFDRYGIIESFILYLVEAKKTEWQEGGDLYNKFKLESEQESSDSLASNKKGAPYQYLINYEEFNSNLIASKSYLFTISEIGPETRKESLQSFNFNEDGLINLSSIISIEQEKDEFNKNGDLERVPNNIALTYLLFQKSVLDPEQFPNSKEVSKGLGLDYLKADGLSLDLEKISDGEWQFYSNLNNFILSEQGINFYFPACVLRDCALGTSEISVTWEDLIDFAY